MLGRLFGKKKKAPATEAPQLSPAIRDSIRQVIGERSVPSMPAAAQKAFQLATDPNAEARAFVEVIQSDEALSARVIKIANSVYFDRGHQTNTIEDAVVVIGISELRALLNATALSDLFPSRHPARTQLWANDVATALTARLLAQRLLPGSEDLAFLAGLMHDVGKLLLLQRTQDDFLKSLKRFQDGTPTCAAEEETFLFNHTELGQFVAEKWNFGPELTAAIRLHHEPIPAEGPALTLSQLIGAADQIAHACGLGHPAGYGQVQRRAEETLTTIWPRLGIPADERKGFLQLIRNTFEAESELYLKGGR